MKAPLRARAANPEVRAAVGARRPMACPTRTLAAAEMPIGIMKVKETQLRAISCPASGTGPRVEIRKVTTAKDGDLDEDGGTGGQAELEKTLEEGPLGA